MLYRLNYRCYTLPLRTQIRTAHGVLHARRGLVVRLESESGVVGYGEAAPLPGFGTETADADAAACWDLGTNPDFRAITSLPAALGCLRHALETAMREANGHPVAHPHLSVAALLPAGKPVLKSVDGFLESGFRIFKWKVGVAPADEEQGLLDDLLGRLPAGAKLRLDANGAWDVRTASRWMDYCADRPIEHVEQPISWQGRGAQDLLLGLAGDFPTPIALDESLVGADDFASWLDLGWPGVFVVKPSLCGDIDGVLARLQRAKAAVVFSSALETAIGAQSALRAAFSWKGEPRALGFGVWPLFADGRFDGPSAAPFIRVEDVERIKPEVIWNALI